MTSITYIYRIKLSRIHNTIGAKNTKSFEIRQDSYVEAKANSSKDSWSFENIVCGDFQNDDKICRKESLTL